MYVQPVGAMKHALRGQVSKKALYEVEATYLPAVFVIHRHLPATVTRRASFVDVSAPMNTRQLVCESA